MYRYSKLSLLAIVVFTCGAAAYAARSGIKSDALAVSQAKIPLAQAVGIAERHVHGKASRAEYERSGLGWEYEVAVASGGKAFDVRVDADTGAVAGQREDRAGGDGRD